MPRAEKGTRRLPRKKGPIKHRDWEAQEQIAFVQWADLTPCPGHPGKIGDYLFAVPNGGYYLKPGMANKMQRMGTKAGVSDLFLAVPTAYYHGLFLEMKRRREDYGSPSRAKYAMKDTQIDFNEKMLALGYFASFAFGANEAIEITEGYFDGG